MGQSIVRQLAFLPPPSSYGPDLPNAWFNKKNGSRVPGLFIPAPDSVQLSFIYFLALTLYYIATHSPCYLLTAMLKTWVCPWTGQTWYLYDWV